MNNTLSFSSVMNQKKVQVSLVILGILMVGIPIIWSIFNVEINCDSAYYISIVERIADGYVPYRTIAVGYTPLWFYIAYLYKLIFFIPNGAYAPYLVLHYFFVCSIAFFLYKIARHFGSNKWVSMLGAWFFLYITHWLNGNVVLLEMPSLYFGLLSVWLLLELSNRSSWHYIWIGGLACCSFLCKQFGLGFIALDIYIMLFILDKKDDYSNYYDGYGDGFAAGDALTKADERQKFLAIKKAVVRILDYRFEACIFAYR